MPLYNLMERGLRLPTLGTIRKGIQVPVMEEGTNRPKTREGQIVTRPKEMPHFVFKCTESTKEGEIGEVEKSIYQLYGTNQIKSLNVFLAYPDAFSNFSFWLEAYTFNQLVARSDERVVTYLFDVESNEVLVKDGLIVAHSSKPNSAAGSLVKDIPVGKPLPHIPDMILGKSKGSEKPLTFKAVGRLIVVIKELRRLATFTLKTGGYWYDIPQIYSSIQIAEQVTQATGRGANTLPMVLRRVEREHTYTKADGSKAKKMGYDVELEIRSDVTAGLLASYEDSPFALSIKDNQPVLPVGGGQVEEEDFIDAVDEGNNFPIPVDEPQEDEEVNILSDTAVHWAAHKMGMGKTAMRQKLEQAIRDGDLAKIMKKSEFKQAIQG